MTRRTRNRLMLFPLVAFGLIFLGDIGPIEPGINYFREETATGVWQTVNWQLLRSSDFAAFMADISLFRGTRIFDRLGLYAVVASDGPGVQRKVAIWIPLWMPAMVVLGAWMMIVTRLPTQSEGTVTCRQCGYDLRATPGRCPECGAVPKTGGRTVT